MSLKQVYLRSTLIIIAAGLLCAVSVEGSESFMGIQRAFLAEKFDRVINEVPAFLKDYPEAVESTKVRIWWALSLERLQRSNDALRVFDELQENTQSSDPLWAEALFWESEVSRRSSRMVRARRTYQRLLEVESKSMWTTRAKMGLGLVYLHQQVFQAAAELFRQVRMQSSNDKVAYESALLEGFCYLRLDRFKEAIDVLNPVLRSTRDPDVFAQAAFYSGESYLGLTEYEKAYHAYLSVIKPSTSDENYGPSQDLSRWVKLAYFGVGWSTYRMNHCQESKDYLDRYLNANGDDRRTQAYFGLASCLVQLGEETTALHYFERILSEDPRHSLAAQSGLAVAAIYQDQGNLDMAKLVLHSVLKYPHNSDDRAKILVQLGTVVMGLGNPAQAKTILTLVTHTEDAATKQLAVTALADAHLGLGELEEAVVLYESVIKMDSHAVNELSGDRSHDALSEYATYQIGRIYLEQEKYESAVQLFQRLIVTAEPERVYEARLALAIAYLNQKQRDLATIQLQAIRKRAPDSDAAARAAYYLGLLALEQGKYESAEAYCTEVITASPNSDEAVEASFLLADLFVQKRSFDRAIDTLKVAYQSNSLVLEQQARAAKRLGDLTRNGGLCEQAIRWYDEARMLQPSLSGELDYRIASCYEEAGDIEVAINLYLENQDEKWQIRSKLAAAKLLEREDRTQEAEAVYESMSTTLMPEAKIAEERLAVLRELVAAKE